MKSLRLFGLALTLVLLTILGGMVSTLASSNLDIGDGLVGYWRFDEGSGTTTADASGNGNTGTLVNGPVWTTGLVSEALSFDGNDDYVQINDDSTLDLDQEFTISLWVKGSDTSNTQMLLTKRESVGYQVWFQPTVGLFLRIDEGANNVETIANTNVLNDQWHHLAVGRSITQHFVYADGVLDNTTADSTLTDLSNDISLDIGNESAWPSVGFNGLIDEVRVYSRALDAQEVALLYDLHAPSLPSNVITLSPTITYQTMTGWEAVAWAAQDSVAFPNYKDALYDLVVNDAGINRIRLEIRSGVENDNDNWADYQAGIIDYATWRGLRYATINDNSDPLVINWDGFYFSELDDTVEKIVLPLKQLVEANGEKLHVNLCYVAFTSQITPGLEYHHDDPDEYAEFVLATYLHLQNSYGFVPDTWEVILEPDNVSQWDGTLVGQAIMAAANLLQANGFTPHFVAPSNTNMGNAVTYFDAMIQVPGVLQYLDEFAYHRYGGVSLGNLQAIADRAVQYDLNTSMLEWWNSSNGYQTLHQDLKIGRNSAWEQGSLGAPGNPQAALYVVDDTNPTSPTIQISDMTKFTRQYYKFCNSQQHFEQLINFDTIGV